MHFISMNGQQTDKTSVRSINALLHGNLIQTEKRLTDLDAADKHYEKKENNCFKGFGDPFKLDIILLVFKEWAEGAKIDSV